MSRIFLFQMHNWEASNSSAKLIQIIDTDTDNGHSQDKATSLDFTVFTYQDSGANLKTQSNSLIEKRQDKLKSSLLGPCSPQIPRWFQEGRKEEQELYLWGRGCHCHGTEHSGRSCSPAGTHPEPGADSPWFSWNQPRQRESPAHTVALPKGKGEAALISELRALGTSQGSVVAQLAGGNGGCVAQFQASHCCLLKPYEQQGHDVRNTPRDAPLGFQRQRNGNVWQNPAANLLDKKQAKLRRSFIKSSLFLFFWYRLL